MALTLLLGGARSGKSARAVDLATSWAGRVVFIATADARDEEMAARIEEHRRTRPPEWTTVEERVDLTGALAGAPADSFVVVDCLTLWVANLLEQGRKESQIESSAAQAAALASSRSSPTVVVSNEVGLGIVPGTPLGRRYRDVLGRVNVSFANVAGRSELVVAGRVLVLEAPQA